MTAPSGGARVLVLPHREALRLSRLRVFGRDRLVLGDDLVLADGDELRAHLASSSPSIALLPAPTALRGAGIGLPAPYGIFTRWPLNPAPRLPQPTLECRHAQAVAAPARTGGSHQRASAPREEDFDKAAVYRLTIPAPALDGEGEVLLRLRNTGDAARAYIDGTLVADHFWYGPRSRPPSWWPWRAPPSSTSPTRHRPS